MKLLNRSDSSLKEKKVDVLCAILDFVLDSEYRRRDWIALSYYFVSLLVLMRSSKIVPAYG